jgi:hypothetical protein
MNCLPQYCTIVPAMSHGAEPGATVLRLQLRLNVRAAQWYYGPPPPRTWTNDDVSYRTRSIQLTELLDSKEFQQATASTTLTTAHQLGSATVRHDQTTARARHSITVYYSVVTYPLDWQPEPRALNKNG